MHQTYLHLTVLKVEVFYRGYFTVNPGMTEAIILSNLLDTVSEHFGDKRIARLCIEHCVIQVALWPVQLKVSELHSCVSIKPQS